MSHTVSAGFAEFRKKNGIANRGGCLRDFFKAKWFDWVCAGRAALGLRSRHRRRMGEARVDAGLDYLRSNRYPISGNSFPAVMKYLVIWIGIAVIAARLLANLNYYSYQEIVQNGRQVQGLVFQLTPEMHSKIRYRYRVDGHSYEGQSQPGPPNPSAPGMGDTVTVYYDPETPNISVISDPKSLLKNEIISIAGAAVLLATALTLVFRSYYNFSMNRRGRRTD